MTLLEKHYDFDFKIDKVASFSKENFNVAEKDWLLNEAQNVIVKQRYGGTNHRRTAFEETQKRWDDLATLHVVQPEQPVIVPTVISPTLLEVPLDSLAYDYWFLTRAEALITDETCGLVDSPVPMRPVQTDDLSEALKDPFSQSSKLNGVIFNISKHSSIPGKSSIYIYPNGLNITGVNISYIKKPRRMITAGYTYIDGVSYLGVECELPEHLHTELVDLAVAIASGIIEHPTYVQLKAQKIFEQE